VQTLNLVTCRGSVGHLQTRTPVQGRRARNGLHGKVDTLLIRTAADRAGIGDNDGYITANAPLRLGASPTRGHAAVTETNPR
jgi:hypothetical protein